MAKGQNTNLINSLDYPKVTWSFLFGTVQYSSIYLIFNNDNDKDKDNDNIHNNIHKN